MDTVFDSLTDKDKKKMLAGISETIKSFSKVRHKDFKRFNLPNGSSVLTKLEMYNNNKEHISVLITNPKSKHSIKENFYFDLSAVGRVTIFNNKANEMIKAISLHLE